MRAATGRGATVCNPQRGRRPLVAGRSIARAAAAAGFALLAACGAAHATSPWLPERGEVLVRLKFLTHETHEAFCPIDSAGGAVPACAPGERRAYPGGGFARDRTLLVEAETALLERLSLDARLTFAYLEYNDSAARRNSRGFGDLTLGARLGLVRGGTPVAPFLSVKIPLADASIAPEALALGDQQLDVEIGVHAGASRHPVFVAGRFGFRARARNDATGRKPGNEVFAALDAGVRAGSLLAKVGFDRMAGEETTVPAPRSGGGGSSTGTRKTHAKSATRVAAAAIIDVTRAASVELGVSVPVTGTNYPAAPTYVIGVSSRLAVRPLSAP